MAKILFIKPSHLTIDIPNVSHPLGLMYLASVLRKEGHICRTIDLRVDKIGLKGVVTEAVRYQPDIIGISCLTVEAKQMHAISKALKEEIRGVKVIVGGPHVLSFSDKTISDPHIDCLCLGEGERTMVELLEAIENGKSLMDIQGICFRDNGKIIYTAPRPPIDNLDTIPFPSWDLIPLERYSEHPGMFGNSGKRRFMTLFTSRGCPYHCIYCHNNFGKSFRGRTPENVVSEIEALMSHYGIKEFEIVDDIFNLDIQRAERICDLIIQKGLDISLVFPNGLRADRLERDLLEKLKRAGTKCIFFPIETASPRVQRLARKNLNIEKALEAISIADKLDILCHSFFMLGFPTETKEEILKTIDFAAGSRLHLSNFFIVTPFPGTELGKAYMDEDGALNRGYDGYQYFRGNNNLSKLTNKELYRLQRYAFMRFYFHLKRLVRTIQIYYRLSIPMRWMGLRLIFRYLLPLFRRVQG